MYFFEYSTNPNHQIILILNYIRNWTVLFIMTWNLYIHPYIRHYIRFILSLFLHLSKMYPFHCLISSWYLFFEITINDAIFQRLLLRKGWFESVIWLYLKVSEGVNVCSPYDNPPRPSAIQSASQACSACSTYQQISQCKFFLLQILKLHINR